MLRIAICDDERIQRRHTAELIDSALAARSADISCFDSSEALLQAVVSGYAPDIAVLDIQMGEMDGISLAKRLNALTPSCRIIFVTSYLAFATEVYSTEHVYFILKARSTSASEAHWRRPCRRSTRIAAAARCCRSRFAAARS